MPNPNAIVSTVIRVPIPAGRSAAEALRETRDLLVELEGDRRVRLDPGDSRSIGFSQILEGLSKLNRPVYLEINPATNAVTKLLIPYIARVVGIRPLEQGVLGVELDQSHARHVLLESNSDFAQLERQLRESLRTRAPIILTENDSHEIIHIRDYGETAPEEAPLPFPRPGLGPRTPWPWRWFASIWWWCWWPWWWWFRCISATKAQQVFDNMYATSCVPLTVLPPCIPFLYPDDGCWGRAHEMCRLMINMGLSPSKVWIQGSLHVGTRNNPNCNVYWGWHVAPTLCVRGPIWFQTQSMVIDPSLFTTPVSKPGWKGVQGDPNATLTDSAASIFYLWGNVTDPTYSQTNQVLATYRLQLQNRAVQHGSPPYANCP